MSAATATATAILTLILVAIDAVWLTIRLGYHKTLFRAVQGSDIQVRYLPAVLVYIILAFVLYKFVISSGNQTYAQVAARGALLGGLMYAFYDATNLATLRGWTWEMAITDSVWGAVLSGAASAAGLWAMRRLKI